MSATPEFRFSIITDTHVRDPAGDLSSPFPVNSKANNRARYACELAATFLPEFTVHLGDMVHPLPHMAAYEPAVEEAHRLFTPLQPALRFVPGNHDIGDKPSPGMPAKPASADSTERYQKAFGPGCYHFKVNDILFLVINSSLVNAGSAAESQQREWLQASLEEAGSQRKFLFSHYPPFVAFEHEDDHYDNYAEPGRHWLLDLAADHGVEAIFSGHVHQFFFNRYRGVKLHCLMATSFTRQDYAELFPVEPASEFGRDDTGKFGVCSVLVNESGYVVDYIPTNGSQLANGEIFVPPERNVPNLPVTPHLRHAWFESLCLPYNGPMEEFSRKKARNDYPLLRILQLGIRSVRVPLADLRDPLGKARIEDWSSLGIRFVFFAIGLPDAATLQLLCELGDTVAGVEILVAALDFEAEYLALQSYTLASSVVFSVSKITTSADVDDPSAVYSHAVSSGFLFTQRELVFSSLLQYSAGQPGVASFTGKGPGLVFQLAWGEAPEVVIPALAQMGEEHDVPVTLNVRFAHPNPAMANFSESELGSVLHKAIALAEGHPRIALQCDTFEDVDRGYCPRFGMIDRRGNIRDVICFPSET